MSEASNYLELALVEKTRELIRKERLTLDLFEILDARMNWLIRFCQKNGIPIPDNARIIEDEARISYLMDQISGTTRDATDKDDHASTRQNHNFGSLSLRRVSDAGFRCGFQMRVSDARADWECPKPSGSHGYVRLTDILSVVPHWALFRQWVI
jgi:hypothetical protein